MSGLDFQGFLMRVEWHAEAREGTGYPFDIPAVRAIESIRFHPRVTCFVGENGSGKSTVLEALAVALRMNAEGGGSAFNFETSRSHSCLGDQLKTVLAPRRIHDTYLLRAESFYNVVTEIDRLGVNSAYGGISLHRQSHGESFMTPLTKRFRPGGLYLLDEPESALSPARQLAAMERISELTQQGAQFIICTHSPILMGYPDATIYQFSSDGIDAVEYEQTEHYAVTKRFLNDRHGMLGWLRFGEAE